MKNLKLYLLTILQLLVMTNTNAQNKVETAQKPTIVFVHGLWADGSSFSKLINALTEKDYEVISVQNSTVSLDEDVAATKRAIARAKGDVILVGHSWGGFVISEAGADAKVKRLIYIAAYAPDKGETVPTLSAHAPETELSKYLMATDEGYITLSKDGVFDVFAQDLTQKEKELTYAVQQPAFRGLFQAVANNAAWKNKPSYFIIPTEDKTIHPELHRWMAKRANGKVIEFKASHVVMLSKAKEVLDIILDAAK